MSGKGHTGLQVIPDFTGCRTNAADKTFASAVLERKMKYSAKGNRDRQRHRETNSETELTSDDKPLTDRERISLQHPCTEAE